METASVPTDLRALLENRESFFRRVGRLWPEGSAQYELIARAYCTAKEALRGIEREEGVRYFEHARGVALVLLDRLNCDDAYAICLALLHDIVEENPSEWNVPRVREEFGDILGEGIAMLTKPQEMWKLTDCGLAYHASFWHAPRRVATVKLADRFHNLTTLCFCSLAKQLRKREETRTHYLPLAQYWGVLAREIELLLDTPPELRLEGIP
ncbi:MAG: (p)ppGpp synthetase SpoT/RelA [Parcubacteria group bacterium]|nr:(p)ppGpp synthetase SpoT/RelA [Parcubacteria group bacterium]